MDRVENFNLHVEVDCNDNIMAVHDAMDLIERSNVGEISYPDNDSYGSSRHK